MVLKTSSARLIVNMNNDESSGRLAKLNCERFLCFISNHIKYECIHKQNIFYNFMNNKFSKKCQKVLQQTLSCISLVLKKKLLVLQILILSFLFDCL